MQSTSWNSTLSYAAWQAPHRLDSSDPGQPYYNCSMFSSNKLSSYKNNHHKLIFKICAGSQKSGEKLTKKKRRLVQWSSPETYCNTYAYAGSPLPSMRGAQEDKKRRKKSRKRKRPFANTTLRQQGGKNQNPLKRNELNNHRK